MARQTVTITLYSSELTYDVKNKTYLTGNSKVDASPAAVAYMQANDDEENANQVNRSIGNAFGSLKTKLSEYIEDNSTSTGNDLLFDGTTDFVLTLKMPSNFNRASIDAISTGLHKYIVNMAVADWFLITNKTDAEAYVAQAAANMAEVIEAINKRVRPTYTPPTPVNNG